MMFDCPPATFKPRIAPDGWNDTQPGVHFWSVTTGSDFRLFDTFGEACAYVRRWWQ
jgi:hypothetical protein